MNNPREFRFAPGSENLALLQSGLWGPNTSVTVDQYVHEKDENGWHPAGYGMEGMLRNRILRRWKDNGMTVDDVGYLADVDEFYSRDYIRAMQVCDVRQLDGHGNCRDARLSSLTLTFEGGPLCMSSTVIRHPDMIIGACIEGIGNSTLHPKPERGWKGTGWLNDGWRPDMGYRSLPKNATHFPLYNAPDFRRISGRSYLGKDVRHTGFHLHNFFSDVSVLRNKYSTYGEVVKGAMGMTLRTIHGDLRVMCDCGLNVSDPTATGKQKWLKGGSESLKGPMPIGFGIPGYVDRRMAELKEMLQADGNIVES